MNTKQENLDLTYNLSLTEQTFLLVARKWMAEIDELDFNTPTSRSADLHALACILLAVESGSNFSVEAREQMEINRQAAQNLRDVSWHEELPWKLCQSSNQMGPAAERDAVKELEANLDHHNSQLRCWMMEIAWFAVPWLNAVEASVCLLRNFANTLMGVYMAAGLAARFFDDNKEQFLGYAHVFDPPETFREQYGDRLTTLEKESLTSVQSHFWRLESMCRKEIQDKIFSSQNNNHSKNG